MRFLLLLAALFAASSAGAAPICAQTGFAVHAVEGVAPAQYLATADIAIDPIIKRGGVLVLCNSQCALAVVPRGNRPATGREADSLRPFIASLKPFTLEELSEALTNETQIAYVQPLGGAFCDCLAGAL